MLRTDTLLRLPSLKSGHEEKETMSVWLKVAILAWDFAKNRTINQPLVMSQTTSKARSKQYKQGISFSHFRERSGSPTDQNTNVEKVTNHEKHELAF